MASAEQLPAPHLNARHFGARCISALTDDALFEATGVRVAFTGRAGGASEGPYASLNLGSHVDDDPVAVERNRALVLESFEAAHAPLLVPNQVHGAKVLVVSAPDQMPAAAAAAAEGADGVVVACPDTAALLCFADCVPVILVAPGGAFAVVHAGWRGVEARIVERAVEKLARVGGQVPTGFNAYVGPHIRACCFEVSSEVRARFADGFGEACCPDEAHVDLACALRESFKAAGLAPERIADAGVCTVCSCDEYFSYRAAGGVCGRHGAFAVRKKG